MAKFILCFILGFNLGIFLFLLFQLFIYSSYERKIEENGRSNNK